MIVPCRGKLLCEVTSREKVLPSGIILLDKQRHEKKDNVARCIGVGEGVEIARRTDLIHFRYCSQNHRFKWEGKTLLSVLASEVIAIERDKIIAPKDRVIVKLVREESIGSIILSDGAKVLEGKFYGEVVDDGAGLDLKPGDRIAYVRDEGHRFTTYGTREDMVSVRERWVCGRYE